MHTQCASYKDKPRNKHVKIKYSQKTQAAVKVCKFLKRTLYCVLPIKQYLKSREKTVQYLQQQVFISASLW